MQLTICSGSHAERRHMQVVTAGNPAATNSPAGCLQRLGERKPCKGNWCSFEPTCFNKINVGIVGW